MERRKDTNYKGEKLPRDYLKLIEGVFNKNFSGKLMGRGKNKETFVIFGEVYPDEVLLAISLKNPSNLRMTTCYASVDFPPPSLKPESGAPGATLSASEAVQMTVNNCVDVVASFFQTYFTEDRPVDYDVEYRQDWVMVDFDKTTKVYIRLNRDNLELEAASDDFIEQHEAQLEEEAEQEQGSDVATIASLDEHENEDDDTDVDDDDIHEESDDESEEKASEDSSSLAVMQPKKKKKSKTLH